MALKIQSHQMHGYLTTSDLNTSSVLNFVAYLKEIGQKTNGLISEHEAHPYVD